MRPKSRIGWTRSSVCFVRQDKYYGPTMTSTGTVYLITGSNHITLEDTILYLSCILAIEIHTHLLYLCHSFASSGLPSIVYRSLLNDIWFQGSFQYEHLEWVQVDWNRGFMCYCYLWCRRLTTTTTTTPGFLPLRRHSLFMDKILLNNFHSNYYIFNCIFYSVVSIHSQNNCDLLLENIFNNNIFTRVDNNKIDGWVIRIST